MSGAFRKDMLVRGALLMTGSTYINYAVGLLISVLIARAVGPDAFGGYSYVVWLSGVLVVLANNGLNTTGIRFISESLGRDEPQAAREVHGWLLRRQHLCMVIMAVAFVACLPLLEPAGWGERSLVFFAAVTLVSLLGKAYYLFSVSVAKGYARFDIEAVSTLSMTALNLVGVGALVLAGAPLSAYLTLFAAISLLHIAAAALLLRRAGIRPDRAAPDATLLARLKPHLAWTVVLTIIYALGNKSIETYLLNTLVGAADVGFFVIAASLTRGGIDLLSSGLTTVLLPAMGHAYGAGGQARVNLILADSVRYFTFLGLILAGAVAFVAEAVITVMYGTDYAPAILVLQTMAVVGGLTLSEGAFAAILATTENQKLRAIFAVGAIVITAVAALLLIPRYGLMGAVAAHAVARLVIFLAFAAITARVLKVRYPFRALAAQFMAAGLALLPAFALVHLVPGMWSKAVAGTLYALLFVGLSPWLGIWKRQDMQTLAGLLARFPRVGDRVAPWLRRWSERLPEDL